MFFYLVMSALPPSALACDYNCISDPQGAGIISGITIGLMFIVSDVTFIGYDIGKAVMGGPPSRRWAIAEVLVGSMQLVASLTAPIVFIDLGFGGGSESFAEAYGGTYLTFGLAFTLASAPLLIHGIRTLVRNPKAADPPRITALLPSPVLSAQNGNKIIGLAWSGTF